MSKFFKILPLFVLTFFIGVGSSYGSSSDDDDLFSSQMRASDEDINAQVALLDDLGIPLIAIDGSSQNSSLSDYKISLVELLQKKGQNLAIQPFLHLTLTDDNMDVLDEVVTCDAALAAHPLLITFSGFMPYMFPKFSNLLGFCFAELDLSPKTSALKFVSRTLALENYRGLQVLGFRDCKGEGLLDNLSGYIKGLTSLKVLSSQQSGLMPSCSIESEELFGEIIAESPHLRMVQTNQRPDQFNPFRFQSPKNLSNSFYYVANEALISSTTSVAKFLLFGKNFQFSFCGEQISGSLSSALRDRWVTETLAPLRGKAWGNYYKLHPQCPDHATATFEGCLLSIDLDLESLEQACKHYWNNSFLKDWIKLRVPLKSVDDFKKINPLLSVNICCEVHCKPALKDHKNEYNDFYTRIQASSYKQVTGNRKLHQNHYSPEVLQWSASRDVTYNGIRTYSHGNETYPVRAKFCIHEGDFMTPLDDDHFWLSRILDDYPTFPDVSYQQVCEIHAKLPSYFLMNNDHEGLYTGKSIQSLVDLLTYTLLDIKSDRFKGRNPSCYHTKKYRFSAFTAKEHEICYYPNPYKNVHDLRYCARILHDKGYHSLGYFASFPDLFWALQWIRKKDEISFAPHFIDHLQGSCLEGSHNSIKTLTALPLCEPLQDPVERVMVCDDLKWKIPLPLFNDFLTLQTNLKSLDIHHNHRHGSIVPEYDFISELMPALSGMKNLEELTLNNCGLTDDNMIVLAPALKQLSKLQSLRLSNTYLIPSSQNVSNVSGFKTQYCDFHLPKIAKGKAIQALFDHKGFADVGATALIDVLPHLPNLDFISLTGNSFSFKATRALVQAIATHCLHIETVRSPKPLSRGIRYFETSANIYSGDFCRFMGYSILHDVMRLSHGQHFKGCQKLKNSKLYCSCEKAFQGPQTIFYLENYRDD